MRDSVGGTFMIYLFLIFLAIYITFVAVAFNYARAFRVKNKVIDIIEQNEGMDESDFNNLSGTNSLGVAGEINEYLRKISYNVNLTSSDEEDRGTCFDLGYCVDEFDYVSNVDGITYKYYKVTTFVKLELPFMNLGFTIPVKGETRKIMEMSS